MMRGAVLRLGAARGQLRLEQEHLLEDIAHVRQRLDDEARRREETEAATHWPLAAQEAGQRASSCRKGASPAGRVATCGRHHQEEVGELLGQIQSSSAAQTQAEARDALQVRRDVRPCARSARSLKATRCRALSSRREWFRGLQARGAGREGAPWWSDIEAGWCDLGVCGVVLEG